jgi:sulfite exporter TauE/SafE/plastocyanin domain-containing protein/copper chaperone CopZ
MNIKNVKINVSDMTCTSCEGRIEREIRKLHGIYNVKASYADGTVEVEYEGGICNTNEIKEAIKKAGYSTGSADSNKLIGVVIIGLAILLLSKYSANFDMSSKLESNVTYLVLLVVGMLTSLHCVGMCGGIMLSQSVTQDATSKFSSLKPSILYNLGRIISYTVLGGIVGAIGSVFNLSLQLKAGISIFAGIFMIIMGLNMAGFSWFRKLHIRLPWSSCSIKSKPRTPFVVGLLNGLMPCGPLQTMQIYALGTGSAVQGALSMLVFSVGTVPLMLLFGAVTGLLSKGYTKKILKFSGVLVLVLGVIMSNRGLALAGINLNPMALLGSGSVSAGSSAKAVIENGVQVVRTTADFSGYNPNVIFVQKGVPVKWIIDGAQITSCNNAIIVPSLSIQKNLEQGENVIEFTPNDTKDINFSCWMGMIRGVIKVVDNLETADTSSVTPPPSSAGGCCAGGAPGAGTGNTTQSSSIYGSDISKVSTDRLVKKATVEGKSQSVNIKGIGSEFEPVIVVINKNIKTKLIFDFTSFDIADGKFQIIDGETGEEFTSFEGKKGIVEVEFTGSKLIPYGISKDGQVISIIEVVDDIQTADLEVIREKYIN